jgi:hypothetical protein
LPWARQHVVAVAKRYHLGTDDLWDEVITALLRVSLHADFGTGNVSPRMHYAQTAIHRACWRYVVRRAEKRPLMLSIRTAETIDEPSDDTLPRTGQPGAFTVDGPRHRYDGMVDLDLELAWASAEEEVMAREAVYLRAAQPCHEKLARKIV